MARSHRRPDTRVAAAVRARIVIVAVEIGLVDAGSADADLGPVADVAVRAGRVVGLVLLRATRRRIAVVDLANVPFVAFGRRARHALAGGAADLVTVAVVAVGTGSPRRAEVAGRRAALAPAGSVVALLPLVHDAVAAVLEGERARCEMCQELPLASQWLPLASHLIVGHSWNCP